MDKKLEDRPTTRARVIRQRTLANGQIVKSVIPVEIKLTQAEKKRLAMQIEWEKWLRLKLR